jgi:hypothetical protein
MFLPGFLNFLNRSKFMTSLPLFSLYTPKAVFISIELIHGQSRGGSLLQNIRDLGAAPSLVWYSLSARFSIGCFLCASP